MKQKIRTCSICTIIIFCAIIYYYIYREPVLRYRGDIYNQQIISDSILKYSYKSNYVLIGTDANPNIKQIEIHYNEFPIQIYKIYDKGSSFLIQNLRNEKQYTIFLKNEIPLFSETTDTLHEYYTKLTSRTTISIDLSNIPISEADAIYIYTTYKKSIRGGGRAPLAIIGVILLFVGLLLKLDGAALGYPKMQYSQILLSNWKKNKKSEQYQQLSKWIIIAWSVLFLVIIGILVSDVLLY